MAHIISPERSSRAAGPALSYWLGSKILNAPLAMEAGAAARLQSAIRDKAFDTAVSLGPLASKYVGTKAGTSGYRVTDDGIAVVPVQGLLIDRGEFLGDLNGWATSYEGLSEQLRRIAKDDAIKAVLLDIDSGGGMCSGLLDLCEQLAELRGKRKVFAVAANMAASAAYAIGCVADELYVSRQGMAGSIGVIALHMSYADMLSQAGVEPTIIHAGSHKPNGNPYQALSHNARTEMSAQCDTIYAAFVAHVAHERRLDPAVVRATEARVYLGEKAVSAKLADGVKSFEETLAHIRGQTAKGGRPRGSKSKSTSASRQPPPSTGDPGMPGHDTSGEQPDYDAVIAAALSALAAAKAAPAAAAAAVVAPAPVQAAAPAAATASEDAKSRVKAILTHASAKERSDLAHHLALETDLPSTVAVAILEKAPAEAAAAAIAALPQLQAAMRKPATSAGIRPDGSAAATGAGASQRLSLKDKFAALNARGQKR